MCIHWSEEAEHAAKRIRDILGGQFAELVMADRPSKRAMQIFKAADRRYQKLAAVGKSKLIGRG